MNWDEMIEKIVFMLENVDYDTVVKFYNQLAYHFGDPEIEHVYDPKKDEEIWILIEK